MQQKKMFAPSEKLFGWSPLPSAMWMRKKINDHVYPRKKENCLILISPQLKKTGEMVVMGLKPRPCLLLAVKAVHTDSPGPWV